MPKHIKVAGCQIDIKLKDIADNRVKMIERAATSKRRGAVLTVFPECALSGYCFDSREEALECAESIPGPSTDKLSAVAQSLDIHMIFGMLEVDGNQLFNSSVLIGPEGIIGKHRKLHLPFLGVDRFVDRGNLGFQVYQIGQLKLGMLICYDGDFPEAVRCLTLLGADLIALSTNFPEGAEGPATYMCQTRAWENQVYYMSANRVGIERGFRFIGQSKVCDPRGQILTALSEYDEGILYADINPHFAREKQIIVIPGEFEINQIKDRRAELYGKLVER